MTTKVSHIISALAVLLAVSPATSVAQGQITYELRAIPGSGSAGVWVADDKNILVFPGSGDYTFSFDIYGAVPNNDNNHANDGICSTYLSFQSIVAAGQTNLPAYVTGVTMDGSSPPYTGFWNSSVGGPQYGTLRDVDGDGDTDLGSTRGADSSSRFYNPCADPTASGYVYGTGTGTDPTSIHIGTLSVKVTNPAPGQGMTMHVLPRYRMSTSVLNYWMQDGSVMTGTGSSTALGSGTGLVFSGTDVSVLVGASGTWNGGGSDDNWTTAANWAGGVPNATTPPQFGPATHVTNNNDFTPGTLFPGITFLNGAPAYHLLGNRIALTGDVINNSTFTQTVGLDLALSSGAGVFNTAAASIVVNGVVSGTQGLTKVGLRTLVLRGTNSYTGPTNLNGGLVQAASLDNLGTGTAMNFNGGGLQWAPGTSFDASTRVLTFAGPATLDTNGNTVVLANPIGNGGPGSLTKTGNGTLVLNSNNAYGGGTIVQQGTLQVGNGGTTGSLGDGAVVNNASLVFNRNDTVVLTNAIGGSGTLTQIGIGTLSLTAANTFTGDARISNGTVRLDNAMALQNSTVDLDAADLGSLDLAGQNVTLGGLKGSRDLAIPTGQTLTVGNNNTSTSYSGVLSGSGSHLTKIGSGTLALTTNVAYTGATNFNGGLIQIPTLGVLAASSALNFNGGGLQWAPGTSFDASTRVLTFAGPATLDTNGNTVVLANPIGNGGPGSLTKTGSGTLALEASNTYTGAIYFNGGVIQASSLDNLGTGTALTFNGGGLQWASGSTFDPSARTMTFSGPATLDTNGNGVILASAIGNGGPGALTKTGSGMLVLLGNNTYTGDTRIASGTLLTNAIGLQNSTVDLNAADSGVLNLSGLSATLGGLKGSRNLAIPNNQTLTVGNNNSNTTYSGVLSGSGSNFAKTGTGTLVLAANNTYTGNTTVSAGVLQITGSLTGNDSSKVLLARGATIIRRVEAGTPYTGLGYTSNALNMWHPYRADLLDGIASAQTDVAMTSGTDAIVFRENSEALFLSGIAPGDTFVLQMVYSCYPPGGALQARYGSGWVPAVTLNTGGTPHFIGNHPYNHSYFALGNYGVDLDNGVAWAVVNYNGEFLAVPEPSSAMLAFVGAVGAFAYIWRRRKRQGVGLA